MLKKDLTEQMPLSQNSLAKIAKFKYLALALVLAFSVVGLKSYNAYAQTDTPAPSLNSETVITGEDIFLKIDGVEGESTDESHPNEIVLDSFSWGESQSASALASIASGRVKFQDLHIGKRFDKSSPILMSAAASGKHYKEATLTVRKKTAGKGQDYLVIKLTDLIVSSYNINGDAKNSVTDSITFDFSKIEFNYTPQKSDGSLDIPVIGGWDLKANKSL